MTGSAPRRSHAHAHSWADFAELDAQLMAILDISTSVALPELGASDGEFFCSPPSTGSSHG